MKADDFTMSVAAEKHERFQKEAEFQDGREQADGEMRDRFAYLIRPALDLYLESVFRFADSLPGEGRSHAFVPGCSTGMVTPLARRGIRTTGVDISPEAIRKLSEAIQQEGLSELATAVCGDAETPDLPESEFDLICCSGVLHHLDIPLTIGNWKRLLRPGGRIIMLEPLAYNPAVAAFRWFTPSQHTEDEHPLTRADLKYLRAEFGSVDVTPINLSTTLTAPLAMLGLPQKASGALARPLHAIDSALFRLLPPTRLLAWSVVVDCAVE